MQPQNYSNDYSDYTPCPLDTCLGCVNGYCTIISGNAESGCFYKDRTENLRLVRHYFYLLKQTLNRMMKRPLRIIGLSIRSRSLPQHMT